MMEPIKHRCDGVWGLHDMVPLVTEGLGQSSCDIFVLIREPIGALVSPMACIRPPALETSIVIIENLLIGEFRHGGCGQRGG